jgi:hypothetical protein
MTWLVYPSRKKLPLYLCGGFSGPQSWSGCEGEEKNPNFPGIWGGTTVAILIKISQLNNFLII